MIESKIEILDYANPNRPADELAPLVLASQAWLQSAEVAELVEKSTFMSALVTQTENHLRHVSFDYEIERGSEDYPHDLAITGPFPLEPTLEVIEKCDQLRQILFAETVDTTPFVEAVPEQFEAIKNDQKSVTDAIIRDPERAYKEFQERIKQDGMTAEFPEFASTVEFIELRLLSGEDVRESCRDNPQMQLFRELVLDKLNEVSANQAYPYRETVLTIERAVEFFDVIQRAKTTELPELYHSGRYEYYLHYLLAESEHVTLPTISGLSASDLIAVRGVPLGFIGVETECARVDGFVQTPYEFFHHDINHSRRMYQFFVETAKNMGKPIDEFINDSSQFIRERVLPAIEINDSDNEEVRERKTGVKMTLFEVLHEDALAAHPDVIKQAILRPELHRTPFERIAGNKVTYFMEPGATTLAYVFRKLSHTFYDTPEQRSSGLGGDYARSRLAIVRAATDLYHLVSGDAMNDEELVKMLEQLVATDEGFPDAFFHEVVEDIQARADTTRDFGFIISKPQTAEASIGRIRQLGKSVHSLFGYSDLGYQDEKAMLDAVSADLDIKDPASVAIAIGATPGGIGQAYELAKNKGFQTIGIVSSKSLANGGNYSAAVDDIFVVRDTEWGGYMPNTLDLTPTTEVFIGASDSISAFGGGQITAVTLAEAAKRARKLRFTPARMSKSLNGADTNGPAFDAWQKLTS